MTSKKEVKLSNPPSCLEFADMRFVIFDAPNDDNLGSYADALIKFKVGTIVRVCEGTYSLDSLLVRGFKFYDLPFPDGAVPPKSVVDTWLSIVKENKSSGASGENYAIGIHCIAGLGRAPVLVAIALIEHGMDAVSAVNLIRSKRRGAINRMQLQYLKKYKRSSNSGCNII